jgi:tetratricopeptide (TPR) repeat protein
LSLQQGDLSEVPSLLAWCVGQPEARETPLILEAIIESTLNRPATRDEQPGSFAPPAEASPPDPAKLMWAVNHWLRLQSNRADQVQGLVWRSQAFAEQGDKESAARDLRTALEIDPDHWDARLQLVLLVGYQAPEEAVANLEILRSRRPGDRELGLSLATFRRQLGQLEEAARILDELLAANPNDVFVLVERGYVELNARKPDQAERFLRRAYEVSPDVPEVNLAFSGWLTQAGRPEEAKSYYDRGLQLLDRRKR